MRSPGTSSLVWHRYWQNERRFEDALGVLTTVAHRDSDALSQSLESVVLVHLERIDDARRADAQKAIELGPALGVTHFSLGYAHLAAAEASATLEEFEKAVQIEPRCSDFLAGKAQAMGRDRPAC